MNKLKAKVVENGMSMDELSRAVGISRDTLYRRLSSGAGSFRVALFDAAGNMTDEVFAGE